VQKTKENDKKKVTKDQRKKVEMSIFWPLVLLFTIVLFLSGCVAPDAIKAKIGALEQRLEQKADNSVVAEQIEEVNNKIIQTTKIYSGAGWVVLGLLLMTVIFLGAIGLFIRWLFRQVFKYKGMLSLLTQSIHKCPSETKKAVKQQIKVEAKKSKKHSQNKVNLSQQVKKDGHH